VGDQDARAATLRRLAEQVGQLALAAVRHEAHRPHRARADQAGRGHAQHKPVGGQPGRPPVPHRGGGHADQLGLVEERVAVQHRRHAKLGRRAARDTARGWISVI